MFTWKRLENHKIGFNEVLKIFCKCLLGTSPYLLQGQMLDNIKDLFVDLYISLIFMS